MIARRLLGLAMLAYPPDLREARGDEIVDTVLDVSHGSPRRVTRESVALIRSGLGARANVTASSGARRLAATVCAQAATVWGLVLLISLLRAERFMLTPAAGVSMARSADREVAFYLVQALLAASVAAALVGYDRIAALLGFALLGALTLTETSRLISTTHYVALLVVPAACYPAMLVMPRARRRDPRRVLWLAAALLLGVSPSLAPTNFGYALGLVGYGLGLVGMVFLVLLLVGLVLLPAGPSLPLAIAVAMIAYGWPIWTGLTGYAEPLTVQAVVITAGPVLLAAGAALTFVSARRRIARN